MIARTSVATQNENDLLGQFLRNLEAVKTNMLELAHSYKACVDAGIDLTRYVNARLAFRLVNLAEGRLLPEAHDKCIGNDRMLGVLTLLSTEQQRELLKDGVAIWRDGEAKTVPVDEIMPFEASRLLDVAGGRPRLLSPEEQAKRRMVRASPRADKIVALRLTPEEYEALMRASKKSAQAIPHYIKQQLYLAGVIPSAVRVRKSG